MAHPQRLVGLLRLGEPAIRSARPQSRSLGGAQPREWAERRGGFPTALFYRPL